MIRENLVAWANRLDTHSIRLRINQENDRLEILKREKERVEQKILDTHANVEILYDVLDIKEHPEKAG